MAAPSQVVKLVERFDRNLAACFRRSLGSHLVQAGVSIYQVSKILRHRDVTTTARHYAHLAPEHGRQELELL